MVKIEKINEVMEYLVDHTWSETADKFKISEMTISRWKKLYENGNLIDKKDFTNKIKKGINRILKKDIIEMNATELKLIYGILTGKFTSMRKDQYILRIRKNIKKIVFIPM